MRPQYAEQYNLTIKREVAKEILFQIAYVGRPGPSAAGDPGNQSWQSANLSRPERNSWIVETCGSQFGADMLRILYSIQLERYSRLDGCILPYAARAGSLPTGTVVGPNGITLVGLRPLFLAQLRADAPARVPGGRHSRVLQHLQQGTIANSAYNALQGQLGKAFLARPAIPGAYTFGKSLDYASTFESLVNPFNPRIGRSPSLFDARHRFVFSYVWELPVPKYDGFAGKILDGWSSLGYHHRSRPDSRFASPRRTTMNCIRSFDFETSGAAEPDCAVQKAQSARRRESGF